MQGHAPTPTLDQTIYTRPFTPVHVLGVWEKTGVPEKTQANSTQTVGPAGNRVFPYQGHNEMPLSKLLWDVPCAPLLAESCCLLSAGGREEGQVP